MTNGRKGERLQALLRREMLHLATFSGTGHRPAVAGRPLDKWSISLLMMVLAFIIETLVVRHYGLAAIFITPLTIFLAEATQLGHGSPNAMLEARLLDTVLGSIVGLAGGICLRGPRFREVLGHQIRRLVP